MDCIKCGAKCCIFKNIGFSFVTLKNAEQIRRKTKKPYSYFLDYSPLSKNEVAMLRTCDPFLEGRMRYLQLKHGRILRLKTKKGGKCIFLTSERCEIYRIRPNICRIFPFWGIRLINRRIKIIEHGINKCSDINRLAKPETAALRRIFRDIEREFNDSSKL